jgi:histidinol-phosphate aminotransferase
MDISKFIRQNVQQMKPYSSARDEFKAKAEIYLDANENPYQNGINRYPDPYQKELKSKIAQIKNIAVSNIFLGNGSDEVIDLVLRAFCEPKEDNIIITPPTYGMYKVAAELNNVQIKESLLNTDFSLNADDLLSKIDTNTKVVILCSPNNPSGNCMDDEVVQQILQQNCLVLIDEAYIDFSERASWIAKLDQYPNLIISQTLSKAYGMAGIRVGMCFASEEIIQVMNKIKPPYNINELSQQKAIEVLNNKRRNKSVKEFILKNKNTLYNELSKLECVKKIYPSEANFFLVKMKDADTVYNKLLDKSIVIRDRSNQPNCNNCLRITVGTEFENEKLILAMQKIN